MKKESPKALFHPFYSVRPRIYDIDRKAWRSMRIDTIWSYTRAHKLTE